MGTNFAQGISVMDEIRRENGVFFSFLSKSAVLRPLEAFSEVRPEFWPPLKFSFIYQERSPGRSESIRIVG